MLNLLSMQNRMLERMHEANSEDNNDDNANAVFKEVLGTRSGYTRGLGHGVIPESHRSLPSNREFERLREENERNKAMAEEFKKKYDNFMGDLVRLNERFEECDRLNERVTQLESQMESQQEALGDA